MENPSPSYAKGPQPKPLLVETIGANLAAHRRRARAIARRSSAAIRECG